MKVRAEAGSAQGRSSSSGLFMTQAVSPEQSAALFEGSVSIAQFQVTAVSSHAFSRR